MSEVAGAKHRRIEEDDHEDQRRHFNLHRPRWIPPLPPVSLAFSMLEFVAIVVLLILYSSQKHTVDDLKGGIRNNQSQIQDAKQETLTNRKAGLQNRATVCQLFTALGKPQPSECQGLPAH